VTDGFPAEPVVPVTGLLVLAGGVLVFATLVAWGPAWTARRTPPAKVLRSE
jgi:ABC-type lipoprotein release transport system permease subunit